VTLSRPAGASGTIYATLDGSDPRVFGSGAVSASAREAAAPILIERPATIRARIANGASWSAIVEASYVPEGYYASLELSEILYNPAGGSSYEFIELHNGGPSSLELAGLRFTDGIDYAFPAGARLPAGGYWVLAADAAAFAERYGGVAVDGVFSGTLDNGGEALRIEDGLGNEVLELRFDDERGWPIGADGFGRSLLFQGGIPALGASWLASAEFHGRPGEANPLAPVSGVVIHEVLANSEAPFEDAIEIRNLAGAAIDVSGWFLSDSRDDEAGLKKFRIPDGTVLAPGVFAVFYEADFNPAPGAATSFALSGGGEGVYLSAADPETGALLGYIWGWELAGSMPNESLGRIETSAGPSYSPLAEPTFGLEAPASVEAFREGRGAENAAPLVGPVVIHEIHYHPASGGIEFVELHNLGGEEVALHDAGLDRGWRLRGLSSAGGDSSYEFPAGAAIAARGYVLVTPVSPEYFRYRVSVPASAPLHGPYGGALSNGGERLRLEAPIDDGAGGVIFALLDEAAYGDREPWPVAADGQGPSLERRDAGAYGGDPANWGASEASGGSPGTANSVGGAPVNRAPSARFSASVLSGTAPLEVAFNASNSVDPDGDALSYAWDFGDGAQGTGRTTAHTFSRAGTFVAVLTVSDSGGLSDEAQATITVSQPPENQSPVASFTLTPAGGEAPLEVTLDASASRDFDGTIAAYRWSFGDGAEGEGRMASHVYEEPGVYDVSLSVVDDRDAVGTRTQRLEVREAPAGGGQEPGDCNQDGKLDISDGVCLLTHLFLGHPVLLPCGDGSGADAANIALLSSNGDARIDLADAVYVLGFLFQGGPPPSRGTECLAIIGCPAACNP
jgi:PKD repeat protein